MKVRLPEEYATRVEMLPLIDIVFLLLVFFIYAMLSMAVHRGLDVELPVSAAASLEKEATLAVSLRPGAEGGVDILVDEEPVELAGLAAMLRERAAGEKERSGREPGVLLFADRRVSYQELFNVLDRISQANLSRISLQADADQQ